MNTPANIPKSSFILVDDHVMVMEGIKEILKTISPESSVDNFNTIAKAKRALEAGRYDFMLMDLSMPNEDTGAFVKFCGTMYPGLMIIILTMVMDTSAIKSCLKMGAKGYLSKSASFTELKRALEEIYSGKTYISYDLTSRLVNNLIAAEKSSLTKRELEIIRLVAKGSSVLQMANILCISSVTIMTHRRNIMAKLGLHSAAELVKYAYDNNLN